MPTPPNPQSQSGLSAAAYAIISLIGLLLGMGLLLFYVYKVPDLVKSGVQNQVFYVLLIPWGLSSAAFLFGAMRGYARFTHKHLGTTLELGGPVVLFCLVVYAGSRLVPPESLSLTVRPSCKETNCLPITSGVISLRYSDVTRDENIGPHTEAIFKGIPTKFLGATISLRAQIDGYDDKFHEFKLSDVLDLPLEKAKSHLRGVIGSVSANAKGIRFFIDGRAVTPEWDPNGNFDLFPVEGTEGKSTVRLRVCMTPDLEYDDFVMLGRPADISLNQVAPSLYAKICGSP